MPWTERSITELRMCFVGESQRGEIPLTALCARYGIRRKTGHKWLVRYQGSGAAGLADRSRARLGQTLSMTR